MNIRMWLIALGTVLFIGIGLVLFFVLGIGNSTPGIISEWDRISQDADTGTVNTKIVFTQTERGTFGGYNIEYTQEDERYALATVAGKRYDLRPIVGNRTADLPGYLGIDIGDMVQIVWQESETGRREIISMELIVQPPTIDNTKEEEVQNVVTTQEVTGSGPTDSINSLVMSQWSLSSLYPSKWGRVILQDGLDGVCPERSGGLCAVRSAIVIDDDAQVFAVALLSGQSFATATAPVWLDGITAIGPDYQEQCAQDNNCTVVISKQGVVLAKYHRIETDQVSGESEVVTQYHIYNPRSTYRLMVFSAHDLDKGQNTGLLFDQYVIDELEFL